MRPAPPPDRPALLVGLTGGIASGKSLVSERLGALGTAVVDADLVAREVVAPGTEGLAALEARFGREVMAPDGTLDRAALRTLAFADRAAREDLDALLHPLIRARSEALIAASAADGSPYTVYAVPLLVETGQAERFDRVLVVDVPVELQRARLLARDGRDAAEADRIIAAQASREARLAVADDVIVNDGPIEDALAATDLLHASYVEIVRARAGAG